MNADHEAVFVFAKPVEVGGLPLEFRLHHELNERYLIGRFALEFSETVPTRTGGKDAQILTAVQTPADQRSDVQRKLLADAYAAETKPKSPKGKDKDVNADVVDLMVMKDLGTPRPTFISLRGDYLRPDEKTGPLAPGAFDAVAPPLPPAVGRTRLDLAKWLVDPQNPLTPRVTMNRAWMRYFGRGLVETEEDFGTQGTPPTHPELLDWLAREFIRQGWSMKTMHRLIVTSATYRQSSHARRELAERDPRNLWLGSAGASAPRGGDHPRCGALRQWPAQSGDRRPERASAAAGGRCTPSRRRRSSGRRMKAPTASAGPCTRCSIAVRRIRSSAPLMRLISRTVCTRRGRSNTPLQALTVANDPAFVELAQGLAVRVSRELPAGELDAALPSCVHPGPEPGASREGTRSDPRATTTGRSRFTAEDAAGAAALATVRLQEGDDGRKPLLSSQWPGYSSTRTTSSRANDAAFPFQTQRLQEITRRHFFGRCAVGRGRYRAWITC